MSSPIIVRNKRKTLKGFEFAVYCTCVAGVKRGGEGAGGGGKARKRGKGKGVPAIRAGGLYSLSPQSPSFFPSSLSLTPYITAMVHTTTGKRAERTKRDSQCLTCRSAIGQASCLICARRRQLTFPFCCYSYSKRQTQNPSKSLKKDDYQIPQVR